MGGLPRPHAVGDQEGDRWEERQQILDPSSLHRLGAAHRHVHGEDGGDEKRQGEPLETYGASKGRLLVAWQLDPLRQR